MRAESSVPTQTKLVPTANNFDLIRLMAALQVAIKHALVHMGFASQWTELLGLFPGVPIFFFISGFLIYQSYSHSRSLGQFAINRLLRIYPALIVCFVVSVALVMFTGYLSWSTLSSRSFLLWVGAQLTVLQIYNAELLRGFGVGVLNGSLWTVAVELQFYVLTPLLAWLTMRQAWCWILVLVLGAIANLVMSHWTAGFGAKLFSVSFPPWFYMFVLGAWLSTRRDWQLRLLRLHPFVLLMAYAAAGVVGRLLGWQVTGNEVNPFSYLLLAMLMFRLAYARPELSEHLLGRNDISYGVYIYHMPVINLLVFHDKVGTPWTVVAACTITVALALASWRLIERPALRLKKLALRNY
ncbi:acyltransferase family protein [Paucibacter soli]|uniref:acyltransferase family protein n=1 Tax=Paucibacter soli TaxID=3133433 RepID=UPI0030A4BB0C